MKKSFSLSRKLISSLICVIMIFFVIHPSFADAYSDYLLFSKNMPWGITKEDLKKKLPSDGFRIKDNFENFEILDYAVPIKKDNLKHISAVYYFLNNQLVGVRFSAGNEGDSTLDYYENQFSILKKMNKLYGEFSEEDYAQLYRLMKRYSQQVQIEKKCEFLYWNTKNAIVCRVTSDEKPSLMTIHYFAPTEKYNQIANDFSKIIIEAKVQYEGLYYFLDSTYTYHCMRFFENGDVLTANMKEINGYECRDSFVYKKDGIRIGRYGIEDKTINFSSVSNNQIVSEYTGTIKEDCIILNANHLTTKTKTKNKKYIFASFEDIANGNIQLEPKSLKESQYDSKQKHITGLQNNGIYYRLNDDRSYTCLYFDKDGSVVQRRVVGDLPTDNKIFANKSSFSGLYKKAGKTIQFNINTSTSEITYNGIIDSRKLMLATSEDATDSEIVYIYNSFEEIDGNRNNY